MARCTYVYFSFVEAEKTGSDIIERIAESRRLRHEETIEDMHQELNIIANVSFTWKHIFKFFLKSGRVSF